MKILAPELVVYRLHFHSSLNSNKFSMHFKLCDLGLEGYLDVSVMTISICNAYTDHFISFISSVIVLCCILSYSGKKCFLVSE